jgi:hypothetical protein
VVAVGGGMVVDGDDGGQPCINLGDPSKFQFILVPI